MLAEMNSVQPSADLSHAEIHKHTAAMPARSPRPSQPRNLTGLFLGTGKTGPPPSPNRNGVPSQYSRATRAMPSRRSRTPTEERRYNKVEMLRIKEDRRGFSGSPVKSYPKQASTTETEEKLPNHSVTNDFWDLTKQTNRQFTSANNSGVSHLEYLVPDQDQAPHSAHPGAFDKFIDSTIVDEIQLANHRRREAEGLLHCYNKICKGNRDALHSLLPNRRSQNIADASYRTTGFSVKSYRTPHQAQILGHFPSPVDSRPRTVDTSPQNRRPLVPGPYFFKGYNPIKVGADSQGSYREHIIGIPGTGAVWRGGASHRQNSSALGNVSPRHDAVGTARPTNIQQSASPVAPSCSPTPRTPRLNPIEHTALPKDTPTSAKPSTVLAEKFEISLPATEAQEQSENKESRPSASGVTDNGADITTENIQHSNTDVEGQHHSNATANGSTQDSGMTQDTVQTASRIDDSTGSVRNETANPGIHVVPPIVIATAESTEDATQENNPFAAPLPEGHNTQIVMRSQGRREEIAELLKEHAQIVQDIIEVQNSSTNLPTQAESTGPQTDAQSDKIEEALRDTEESADGIRDEA